MRIAHYVMAVLLLVLSAVPVTATTQPSVLEQAVSDTLDLWREGRYEQLFELLSRRGKTSREQFVRRMNTTTVRPACCWQKLENFRVLNEKKSTATVYAKVGLEGTPGQDISSTRELKLYHEGGGWKMQLNDLYSLADARAKKKRSSHKNSVYRP